MQKVLVSQLPVDWEETTIVLNAENEVVADLSEGDVAAVWLFIVEQTNNGATAEDVTVGIEINGVALTIDMTLASGTPQYIFMSYNLATGAFSLSASTSVRPTGCGINGQVDKPFSHKIGRIYTKQTTAVDAVSANHEVNIVWDKWQVI